MSPPRGRHPSDIRRACSSRYFAIRSLAEPRFAHYTNVRYEVLKLTIDLWLPFRLTGVSALANRFPELYEKYFAFRFPAMNIRAELMAVK